MQKKRLLRVFLGFQPSSFSEFSRYTEVRISIEGTLIPVNLDRLMTCCDMGLIEKMAA